ncbi:hypothetical protein F5Y17DRAFT_133159 [Xylariaceae sp. FL0594]|nr:hypothetical protein F5Y17DRAFT_133159 [Xylariaceae sp. FL0594]
MSSSNPEKGDKVSWNWGSGTPSGTVAETREEGSIEITSKRGNTIKKNASADNPAVRVERPAAGNDVVKRASELTVDEKAADQGDDEGKEGGTKRKAEGEADVDEKGEDGDAHTTTNEQGNEKEVKKGGKDDANKRQKREQDADVKEAKSKSKLDTKSSANASSGGDDDNVAVREAADEITVKGKGGNGEEGKGRENAGGNNEGKGRENAGGNNEGKGRENAGGNNEGKGEISTKGPNAETGVNKAKTETETQTQTAKESAAHSKEKNQEEDTISARTRSQDKVE